MTTTINYPHENTLKVVERAKAVAQGDDYYYEYCGKIVAGVVNECKNLWVKRSFSAVVYDYT